MQIIPMRDLKNTVEVERRCAEENGPVFVTKNGYGILVAMFGKEARDGILIDLKITNDDIAGFCGISTRHSVNRILRGLREEHVIRTLYNKIMVLDVEHLKQFVDVKVDA